MTLIECVGGPKDGWRFNMELIPTLHVLLPGEYCRVQYRRTDRRTADGAEIYEYVKPAPAAPAPPPPDSP